MTFENWEPSIINNMSLAILVLDDDLRILRSNQSAQNILCASEANLQRKKLQQVVQMDDDCLQQCQQSLISQQSFTLREVVFTLPAQAKLLLDLTLTPLQESSGSGALLLELQLKDRFARLSESQHIQNQRYSAVNLVQNFCQEINNPLGAIKGAGQLLKTELDGHVDEKQQASWQEYTQVIIHETNRLRDLVDKLLGPRRAAQKQSTNIHWLIDQSIGLLQAETHLKQPMSWQRDFDPSIPDFFLDSSQIIQVLINMGRNSLQAIQEQVQSQELEKLDDSLKQTYPQDDFHITFKTRAVRNFTIEAVCHRLVCCISIIDNGAGIDPLFKDQIFLPMVSTRQKGNGLGLNIAYHLVAQHQGSIDVISYPRKTRFDIFLPMNI